jgi:hypothetical protein
VSFVYDCAEPASGWAEGINLPLLTAKLVPITERLWGAVRGRCTRPRARCPQPLSAPWTISRVNPGVTDVAVPIGPVNTGGVARSASGRSLRLKILGPLRLWRDDVELDVGPRQQAYLLALLLVREGRSTSAGELIDLIWGEEAPDTALNVIHKYVGTLWRLLEPTAPAPGNRLAQPARHGHRPTCWRRRRQPRRIAQRRHHFGQRRRLQAVHRSGSAPRPRCAPLLRGSARGKCGQARPGRGCYAGISRIHPLQQGHRPRGNPRHLRARVSQREPIAIACGDHARRPWQRKNRMTRDGICDGHDERRCGVLKL